MRFHFVLPVSGRQELDRLAALDPRADWRDFNQGRRAWILQTYLRLRESGMEGLSLGRRPRRGAVNLAHIQDAQKLPLAPGTRLAVCIAEWQRDVPASCARIVQNHDQIARPRDHWIPHWPQAGLRQRRSDDATIREVAFAGLPEHSALLESELLEMLARRFPTIRFRHLGPESWNDFSGVDVTVGLRSLDANPHHGKPPTKLINAWRAGTPFIGGADSAYTQVGTPGEDYLAVDGLESFIGALERLVSDPALFHRLATAGRERARAYSFDAVTAAWRGMLGRWAAGHPSAPAPLLLRETLGFQVAGLRRRVAYRLGISRK